MCGKDGPQHIPPLGSGREGDESLVCVTDYDPKRGITICAWVTCYQSMKCTNKIMYLNNSVTALTERERKESRQQELFYSKKERK
jgi:hypothetical protein